MIQTEVSSHSKISIICFDWNKLSKFLRNWKIKNIFIHPEMWKTLTSLLEKYRWYFDLYHFNKLLIKFLQSRNVKISLVYSPLTIGFENDTIMTNCASFWNVSTIQNMQVIHASLTVHLLHAIKFVCEGCNDAV